MPQHIVIVLAKKNSTDSFGDLKCSLLCCWQKSAVNFFVLHTGHVLGLQYTQNWMLSHLHKTCWFPINISSLDSLPSRKPVFSAHNKKRRRNTVWASWQFMAKNPYFHDDHVKQIISHEYWMIIGFLISTYMCIHQKYLQAESTCLWWWQSSPSKTPQ